jgi:crossover junction endodeoxyribonuclease RuvC
LVTVIGIDPGSQRTGWGVVREAPGSLTLLECGVVRAMPGEKSFSARLAYIYHEIFLILTRHSPDEAAVEQVFTAKNALAALKLGQARGAAVAACAAHSLPISDYAPTMVKQSLAGAGRAEKEQVAFMVKRLLNIKGTGLPLDASDALAVALCHLNARRLAKLTRQAAGNYDR